MRTIKATLAVLFFTALAGCTSSNALSAGTCDSPCPTGTVCMEGACAMLCTSNADCFEGEVCGADNVCGSPNALAGEHLDGEACDDGVPCTINDVWINNVCQGTSACGDCEQCNADTGACEPATDLGPELSCGDQTDNDCNGLVDCQDAACQNSGACSAPTCDAPADCGPSDCWDCVNNRCEAKADGTVCGAGDSCIIGGSCQAGGCVADEVLPPQGCSAADEANECVVLSCEDDNGEPGCGVDVSSRNGELCNGGEGSCYNGECTDSVSAACDPSAPNCGSGVCAQDLDRSGWFCTPSATTCLIDGETGLVASQGDTSCGYFDAHSGTCSGGEWTNRECNGMCGASCEGDFVGKECNGAMTKSITYEVTCSDASCEPTAAVPVEEENCAHGCDPATGMCNPEPPCGCVEECSGFPGGIQFCDWVPVDNGNCMGTPTCYGDGGNGAVCVCQ